jgi:hypothetical protein
MTAHVLLTFADTQAANFFSKTLLYEKENRQRYGVHSAKNIRAHWLLSEKNCAKRVLAKKHFAFTLTLCFSRTFTLTLAKLLFAVSNSLKNLCTSAFHSMDTTPRRLFACIRSLSSWQIFFCLCFPICFLHWFSYFKLLVYAIIIYACLISKYIYLTYI